MLKAYLDYYRETMELKCAGVAAACLSERSSPPSTMSLHGLVRHLAEGERWWFAINFAGPDLPMLSAHLRRPRCYADRSLEAARQGGHDVATKFSRRLLGLCAGGVLVLGSMLGGALLVGASSANVGTPPQPPSNVTVPHAVGPFLEPVKVPGQGYYVTCNLNDLSVNCQHLVIVTSAGDGASLAAAGGPALTTFLINVPSAYQYLANWVPYNIYTPRVAAQSLK